VESLRVVLREAAVRDREGELVLVLPPPPGQIRRDEDVQVMVLAVEAKRVPAPWRLEVDVPPDELVPPVPVEMRRVGVARTVQDDQRRIRRRIGCTSL